MTGDGGDEEAMADTDLSHALDEVRVSVQGVEREHARARIAAALFGDDPAFSEPQGPVTLDRFVILDKLGRGGMGVVYSAYDPQLDRRVALKLLQSGAGERDTEGRTRLLREAQALARLSHPNVVPIHDVGMIEDQVFMVMEFVEGRDLNAWCAATEPDWRAILEVYLQAGRGLAAAHDAGLVHRDFKPENAIVGQDGRVRVLDFGLARGRGASVPETAAAVEADGKFLDISMTATGTIMGTPAYMSPEQYVGAQVDHKSDQFSFCVALYEAVFGERPYPGQTVAELQANLRAGRMRDAPRQGNAPGSLATILRRGLAHRPDDRYPSMNDLLGELAPLVEDPARRRRRWLLSGGALALAALSATVAYTMSAERPLSVAERCAPVGDAVRQVWNTDVRAAIDQALTATGHPYAERAALEVGARLDGYADAWADMRRAACVTHGRGEQSDTLFDRRMRCLDRRKHALASAASVLSAAGPETVEHSVVVAQELPPISYCADVAALEAEVPPPEDPEVAARVAELERSLLRAKVEEDAAHYAGALARVDRILDAARAVDHRPLVAQGLLARGRVLMLQGKREMSIEPLDQAVKLGVAVGMDSTAMEALARRIYAEGTVRAHAPLPVGELELGLALASRLSDATFVTALMLNNAGVVELARGAKDAARAHLERALTIKREARGQTPLELATIATNLAIVTPDPERRTELARAARAEMERALGADHPKTLIAALSEAIFMRDMQRAQFLRRDACERLLRYHPALADPISDCLYYGALTSAELGHTEQAVATLGRLLDYLDGRTDDVARRFGSRALGFLAVLQGDCRAARDAFQARLADLPDQTERPWWLDLEEAETRLGMGRCELQAGQSSSSAAPQETAAHLERAVSHLERALVLFERVTAMSPRMDLRHQQALTQFVLARALVAAQPRGSDPDASRARAFGLAEAAQAWYLGDTDSHAARLAELEAWRAAH